MNQVKLWGNLYQTPTFSWVSGVKEAWIWLLADGQWLPVLCRGPAADAACQCQPGVQVEVTGSLECVQVTPETWSLKVVAVALYVGPSRSPAGTVQARRAPNHTDWDEKDDYEDFLVEISPGFYWDPIQHEYVGDPDDVHEGWDDYEDDDDASSAKW